MQLNIDDLGVVGIIVEDWDITKEFKPKTLTTDYSSWITYISRKHVPANTPITDVEYWKPIARLQNDLSFDYNVFKEELTKKMYNLTLLVYTFLESTEHGMAIANEFGDGELIAVNQKTLTEAINDLYSRLEDITGETTQGIVMEISPDYYIGEEGCDVHISAHTVDTNGKFESIKFYANGTLIAQATNVDKFPEEGDYFEHHIDETTVIKCEAKILGIPYTQQKIVTHYNSYWLGCGTSYQDVMVNANLKPITDGMRGSYDVVCAQGDHIIIILGESLRPGFIRADMNSFEIPFVETTVTVDGNVYAVLKSQNAYQAGTYNIDING